MNTLHISSELRELQDDKNYKCLINSMDANGQTYLHLKAQEGNVNDVKFLIATGAVVYFKDRADRTPLLLSSRKHYAEITKCLIAAAADVNVVDIFEETPLLHSARVGDVDIVYELVAAGADVDATDRLKETPLHHSARGGDKDIVEILIYVGADINKKNLFLETPLHHSVRCGEIDIVKILIAAGADVNAKDKDGETSLYKSAISNEVHTVKLFIAAGSNINTRNKKGKTALDMAYKYGYKEMCEVLIKYTLLSTPTTNKAKFKDENLIEFWKNCEQQVKLLQETFLGESCVSLFTFVTETEKNKLAVYSSEESYGIANCLSKNLWTEKFPTYLEDIQTQFNKGTERAYYLRKSQEVMKHFLFKSLPLDIIRKISEYLKNEDLDNLISIKGTIIDFYHLTEVTSDSTPTVFRNNASRISAKNGCLEDNLNLSSGSVNLEDANEQKCLHNSVQEGNVNDIKALIATGVDVDVEDFSGRTPLILSSRKHYADITKILIAAGADVNVIDEFEETALLHSARVGDVDLVNKLVAAGADVDAADRLKESPLHHSARGGDKDIVEILIAAGADVNEKNLFQETPLHLSVRGCAIDIVKILIAAGVDVNAKDQDLQTPLHECTYSMDLEIMTILIAAGADLNAKDKYGDTSLYISATANHLDTVKLLIAAGANVNVNFEDVKAGYYLIDEYSSYKEMCEVLIKYTLLSNPTTNKAKFEDENLKEFWNNCEQQVKLLQETCLGESCVSLFTFVTETEKNKLAIYSSEESYGIANCLSKNLWTEKFPTYLEDIQTQFNKGTERAYYLRKSQEVMKNLLFKSLPLNIIIKISEYLKNEDMDNLFSNKCDVELSNAKP